MFLLVQQFLRHNENFFFFARSIVSLKKRATTESPVRERKKVIVAKDGNLFPSFTASN